MKDSLVNASLGLTMAEQSGVSAVPGGGHFGADQPATVGATMTSAPTEEDEESEWEYEYSSTETEVRFNDSHHQRLATLTFADVLPDSRTLLSRIQKRSSSQSAS